MAGAPSSMSADDDFKVFARGVREHPAHGEAPAPREPCRAALRRRPPTTGRWPWRPRTPRVTVRRGIYNHVAALPFTDQELYETDARLAPLELDTYQAAAATLADDPRRPVFAPGRGRGSSSAKSHHFDRTFAGVISQAAVGLQRAHGGPALGRAPVARRARQPGLRRRGLHHPRGAGHVRPVVAVEPARGTTPARGRHALPRNGRHHPRTRRPRHLARAARAATFYRPGRRRRVARRRAPGAAHPGRHPGRGPRPTSRPPGSPPTWTSCPLPFPNAACCAANSWRRWRTNSASTG